MITFNDLRFEGRCDFTEIARAKLFFPNNYGISVINFGGYDKYEIAVIKKHEDGSWSIDYDTSVTDDVIPNLSSDEVTKIMQQIANL